MQFAGLDGVDAVDFHTVEDMANTMQEL